MADLSRNLSTAHKIRFIDFSLKIQAKNRFKVKKRYFLANIAKKLAFSSMGVSMFISEFSHGKFEIL